MKGKEATVTSVNTHLMVPIFIFAVLLSAASIRGPAIISSTGIGSAVIVVAPLILATYALTIIVMAGRAGVDLSIGPLIGFLNVGLIQLIGAGIIESPVAFFLYAIGVGVAYQLLMGLIIVFVRVQPIIVSLSGYLALVGLNLIILPRPGGVAPDWMLTWGSGTDIWSPILVILIIATAGWYGLANTAFFGHLRLMGSDERAAYTSGVKINLVRLGAHCIAGVFAGLAAVCFTSLISSGDPTQGTTFTLMAVTALVLGGANLAGGRGGAFGSLFGALNIYLITYLLGTFNFGTFQSFVTDLSYGSILVLSLLISLALPQIQKAARYLSPVLFIAILGTVAGGVIFHATLDISTVQSVVTAAVNEVPAVTDAAAADASSRTGTVILLVILGIAGAIYLLSLLLSYPRPLMGAFLVIIAVTGLGLIFHPASGVMDSAAAPAAGGLGTALEYMALESTEIPADTGAVGTPIVQAAYAMLLALGITFLASLIIRLNTPSRRIVALSAPAILTGLVLVGISVLAAVSLKSGAFGGVFSNEALIVLLVVMLLFVLAFSPLQSLIPNVANVYITGFGILALGFVYFWAPSVPGGPSQSGPVLEQVVVVAAPAAPKQKAEAAAPQPQRLGVSAVQNTTFVHWAYSIFVVVLLQYAVWLTMRGGYRLRQFWPYLYIVVGSALAWSAMFYSVGVSLWNIAIVCVVAALTAPFVWRAFGTFARGRTAEAMRS